MTQDALFQPDPCAACNGTGRVRDRDGAQAFPPGHSEMFATHDKFPEGDPVEVRPSDSRAESQAGLKGPSGCPNSPSGRVTERASHRQEGEA